MPRTKTRTIIFCFGGRKANLALQLPFIHRILADNTSIEYHLWNLSRDPADDAYIRGLSARTKRFKVINMFHQPRAWERFNDVYRYYATPDFKDCRFVKLDDDVVFIQDRDLKEFIAGIEANPHAVLSGEVINNGACTRLDAKLYDKFRRLGVRLLDVHLSPQFAFMAHDYFFEHWPTMTRRPLTWVPTEDWLSINFIGYDYEMGKKLAALLDTPSPRRIAGRVFPRGRSRVGDEGGVNMLPRIIVSGFMVGHLTFGPQERKTHPSTWTELRARYAEVGAKYREET